MRFLFDRKVGQLNYRQCPLKKSLPSRGMLSVRPTLTDCLDSLGHGRDIHRAIAKTPAIRPAATNSHISPISERLERPETPFGLTEAEPVADVGPTGEDVGVL